MVHHAVLLSRAANKVSYGFIKQTSRVALASALGAALVNITTGLGTQESYRGTGTQEPGTGTQEQGPRNWDPGTSQEHILFLTLKLLLNEVHGKKVTLGSYL